MKGCALENPKLGNIGVTVKIMMTDPDKLLKIARTEVKTAEQKETNENGNTKNEKDTRNE